MTGREAGVSETRLDYTDQRRGDGVPLWGYNDVQGGQRQRCAVDAVALAICILGVRKFLFIARRVSTSGRVSREISG